MLRLDLREETLVAGTSADGRDLSAGGDGAPVTFPYPGDLGDVLVVDDDPVVARLIRALLEMEGHRVTVAGDGFDALRLVASEPPPALVVLDWMLPRANGLEVLRAIRSGRWRNVPVVMVSGRATEDAAVRAFQAGADDFVTKPFGPAELVARAARLLRPALASVAV